MSIKDLAQTQEISFPVLFNSKFMSACSRHESIQEFIDASGLNLTKDEILSVNGTPELDQFVNSETTYNTWKEMRETAWQTHVDEQVAKV